MRAILLLVGASQALRPTLPPRTKTALNAFTNPFAKRPEEMQELEPYETAPLFGECRRKLAACIIVGFEDFGGAPARLARRSPSFTVTWRSCERRVSSRVTKLRVVISIG